MDSYMAAKQITSVYAAVLTPRLVDDSVGFLRQGVGGGDVPIEEAMAGETAAHLQSDRMESLLKTQD